MTRIELKFSDKTEPVTVDLLKATTANPELQKEIDAAIRLVPVKPSVNLEPWLARMLITAFDGKIIEEPPWDPNIGDVTPAWNAFQAGG